MQRRKSEPRRDWQKRVEEVGLSWHSGVLPYWDESAFYAFTPKEIDLLESSTNDLEQMTLEAVQYIVDNKLYSLLAIPDVAVPSIEKSWVLEYPSIYGRFDFAFDGVNPPKLLEYNADTPTSLVETSVAQWFWLNDLFPHSDQFNSLHERLLSAWSALAPHLPGSRIDFCSIDDAEDGMTVTYLHDTARQAGLSSSIFPMNEVGWDGHTFVGPDNQTLETVFKLYPWEWMVREEFSPFLSVAATRWIEPQWKMLLSNKGILPILWTLYPGHPNLLPASFEEPSDPVLWVRKPLLGREGANVTIYQSDRTIETEGDYGSEGFVYQRCANLFRDSDYFSVVGSWVIGHEAGNTAAGIGIRESDTPITTNGSRFIPHLID